MTTRIGRLIVALALLVGSLSVAHASDMPATGGGVKELPGTIQKDVGDAVKKDLGGYGGYGAAKGDTEEKAGKKAGAEDAGEDAEGAEEDAE
jgi:hypothetical protein